MLIPGTQIAQKLQRALKKEILNLKKKKRIMKLTVFLLEQTPEQLSFVKIKRKVANSLGVLFDFVSYKETPSFEQFMHDIKTKSADPTVTGIIIQQPLPPQLQTESIYEFINEYKEIEGHRKKALFLSPLGLAILTTIKFVYGNQKINDSLFIDVKKDFEFFRRMLKNKKVVLVGRGMTGGKPIARTLSEAKIGYIGLHSETPQPIEYLREADLIITAVGKKVIFPEMLKPGAILLNVGLRHEKNKLLGDFDEKEVKNIVSFYSPTPGGIGPIDVLYLYKNLLDAAKMQQ